MTQEEKDLLLKDLCARLSYGICVELPNHHLVKHIYSIKSINMENGWTTGVLECAGRKKIYSTKIEDVKPYLRPLSSMTEEEKLEFSLVPIYAFVHFNEIAKMDWLNEHHFDYRGLIDRGLALSTEEFNPYKD